jgi:type II secretory pathway pseudopilin PulG
MKMRADNRSRKSQAGMTLIETMIAAVILIIGVAAVASVYTQGVLVMGASQDDFIAKEKAREAVESVFTARDTRVLAWAQICNVSGAGVAACAGGVFKDGPFPINDPGPDGLVNTADDGPLQNIVLPGPDNLLGTADDVLIPLAKFTREIQIRDIAPNLRSLVVIMRYRSGRLQRSYTLTTYVSQFS